MKAVVVASSLQEALEGLSLASRLGDPVVVAYGKLAEEEGLEKLGVRVIAAKTRNPEQVAEIVGKLVDEGAQLVVGWPTRNNRDIFSRVAGARDLPLATDVVEVELGDGEVVYKRGILSERATAKEAIPYPALLLVNPKVLEPYKPTGQGTVEEASLPEAKTSIVGVERKQLSGINLEEAEIIVGVGRGFKKKEDLKLAFELAELLGAQVGATRPIAADYKWLPEDAWIGISGKRVAPKLYIAIGISGAPQHMAGVMNAKIIVAINKDKTAPIFKQADYGVVADLYQFIPVLIKVIREKKGA